MSAASRIRLMPVVITAAAALLGLKAIGIATHTSYLFVPPAAAASASHGAEKPAVADDHGAKEGAPVQPRPVEKPPVDAKGELTVEESSQKALTEALSKRREAIDARTSELDMREATLKATEKRLDDRLNELKRLEQAIGDADKRRAELEQTKFKELVILYEGMKPKEAARIFEKLDAQVLLDVASRMKPRTLSVVMGVMEPDAAQKLTVALARREASPPIAETASVLPAELPKIEGRPNR
ncbi:MotE family protein [Chenggangzhangella methanolivorans]|uniref:Flagellar motility protein MotE, a chaperone for MotC folding n=1 Tax=Chenggangzhangella methanolivorans TaxID=1437009 RepID=A0A9E6RD07_9HYPH|nr:hypothetical protein [Chenggangzhangella methanolivorans]QZO00988.1 hypothetical protein K6K41_05090 [Chenggangzhangella methanolivorans]